MAWQWKCTVRHLRSILGYATVMAWSQLGSTFILFRSIFPILMIFHKFDPPFLVRRGFKMTSDDFKDWPYIHPTRILKCLNWIVHNQDTFCRDSYSDICHECIKLFLALHSSHHPVLHVWAIQYTCGISEEAPQRLLSQSSRESAHSTKTWGHSEIVLRNKQK